MLTGDGDGRRRWVGDGLTGDSYGQRATAKGDRNGRPQGVTATGDRKGRPQWANSGGLAELVPL